MLNRVSEHSRSVPLSGSATKVNGVYSELETILHPSFVKIFSVVFLCDPGDKAETNKPATVKT